MFDSADGTSPKTGLNPTVTISKNGAVFASPAGAVTEISAGWYKVAGNATDTNTLGVLTLHATASGAAVTDAQYEVVAYDPDVDYNAAIAAVQADTTNLKTRVPAALVSGRIDASVGAMATDTLTAAALATDAVTEIQSGLATAAALSTVSGYVDTEVAAIKAKTDNLPASPANEATLATIAGYIDTEVASILSAVDTEVAAIKAKTDNLPASPAAVGSAMTLDLTQAVPTSNTAQTVGDALNAARAQGFGKWTLQGTQLTLYAANGTTVVKTFVLDDATAPTSRT
jgi:hypothetical protein